MKTTLTVTGMNCPHCEKRVENALNDIDVKARADAKNDIVQLEFTGEKIEDIKKIIEILGYKVNG